VLLLLLLVVVAEFLTINKRSKPVRVETQQLSHPTPSTKHILRTWHGIVIGKMVVPLGWYLKNSGPIYTLCTGYFLGPNPRIKGSNRGVKQLRGPPSQGYHNFLGEDAPGLPSCVSAPVPQALWLGIVSLQQTWRSLKADFLCPVKCDVMITNFGQRTIK